MQVERVSQDSTVRVPLPNGLQKGQSSTLNFEYEGDLISAEDSPVAGLKLAYVGDPSSYLLYAGRWFPVVGYGTNRFTATIRVTVPEGYTVVGSGNSQARAGCGKTRGQPASASVRAPHRGARSQNRTQQRRRPRTPAAKLTGPQVTYTFAWDKPSFPGTLIIGKFEDDDRHRPALLSIHVFFPASHKQQAQQYGEAAGKEFNYFTTLYGVPMSTDLKVVELARRHGAGRLGAGDRGHFQPRCRRQNELPAAGQHDCAPVVGSGRFSPATRNDWWITDGLARYAEAQYVEYVAGKGARGRSAQGYVCRRAGLRHGSAGQLGTLDPFDPGISVAWPPTRAAWSSTCFAG